MLLASWLNTYAVFWSDAYAVLLADASVVGGFLGPWRDSRQGPSLLSAGQPDNPASTPSSPSS